MTTAFSKTVRIDLMPPAQAEKTVTGRNSLLMKSQFNTRQRQATKTAQEGLSRYDELLESVYDAALITSPAGKIIEVNGRAMEFLGYDRDELCGGMSMIEVIDGADDEIMRTISETLLTERFALLQAFCRRQDGSLFPAEIAVNRLSMDNVRLCFFMRDVTVRYQTEEQLRAEHRAMQICSSGIAICDTDGILAYANPAFAAIVGVGLEALPGYDIRQVLPSQDNVDALMENALIGDQAWLSEFDVQAVDGRALYLQVAASGIHSEDGATIGVVFSLADFTRHQRAETGGLAYLEALEASGEATREDVLGIQANLESRIAVLSVELEAVKIKIGEYQ